MNGYSMKQMGLTKGWAVFEQSWKKGKGRGKSRWSNDELSLCRLQTDLHLLYTTHCHDWTPKHIFTFIQYIFCLVKDMAE